MHLLVSISYLINLMYVHGLFKIVCLYLNFVLLINSRSQWPRGLRCGSTAARLLGLWVRIPPGAWMSVCVECCQVEVSATGWSLVRRSPTDCDASLCVIYKPQEWGGHGPRWAAAPQGGKIFINNKIIKFTLSALQNDKLYKQLISFLISGKARYISQHFAITRPSIIELNGSEILNLFSYNSFSTAKSVLFITICKYLIS